MPLSLARDNGKFNHGGDGGGGGGLAAAAAAAVAAVDNDWRVSIHILRTVVLDYGELLAYWFILHGCSTRFGVQYLSRSTIL